MISLRAIIELFGGIIYAAIQVSGAIIAAIVYYPKVALFWIVLSVISYPLFRALALRVIGSLQRASS